MKLAIVLHLALLAALPAAADDALALMRESDRRLRAAEETVRYRMELYEDEKLVHARELVRMDKRFGDRSATLVRFSAPPAIRNTALLIEDRGGAINDIWSYLPATRTLRRIAGAQKQNWFMGSEFAYEDFEDYKLAAYRFESRSPLEPCLSWRSCLVVDAIPAADEEIRASGYARKRYFLERQSLFPVRIDYLDAGGAAVKRLFAEGLRKEGEHVRATAQVMLNLQAPRKTRLVVLRDEIGTPLPESLFSQRGMREEAE